MKNAMNCEEVHTHSLVIFIKVLANIAIWILLWYRIYTDLIMQVTTIRLEAVPYLCYARSLLGSIGIPLKFALDVTSHKQLYVLFHQGWKYLILCSQVYLRAQGYDLTVLVFERDA